MDEDLGRPPLDLGIFQSIELEQYEIHKRSLAALKELQVLESAAGESAAPRNPARLSQVLANYAKALFDAEAKRYPDDADRPRWLAALATRIEAMMSRRIWEMDITSAAKLTHHASREEIDAMMGAALRARVAALTPPPLPAVNAAPALASLAHLAAGVSNLNGSGAGHGVPHPAPQHHPHAAAESAAGVQVASPVAFQITSQTTTPIATQVAVQIRTLRREARLTVEELAGKVGIASRTVQRHESGEVLDIRLRHVRQYEKVFTSLLKRPVRINNGVPVERA